MFKKLMTLIVLTYSFSIFSSDCLGTLEGHWLATSNDHAMNILKFDDNELTIYKNSTNFKKYIIDLFIIDNYGIQFDTDDNSYRIHCSSPYSFILAEKLSDTEFEIIDFYNKI